MKCIWDRFRLLSAILLAGVILFVLPETADAQKRWREYTDCMLLPNAANDGDSFHVNIGSLKTAKAKHKLIRLYFVDTPESDHSLPDRLEMQRAHWDLPDIDAVVRCGKEASKFTEDFLKDGFTLYSRLADALGRSKMDRDAGLVWANGKDLGTELVRAGLARIGGFTTDMSDLDNYKLSSAAYQKRLRQAEMEAKAARRGCWGYTAPATGPARFVRQPTPRPATPSAATATTPAGTMPAGMRMPVRQPTALQPTQAAPAKSTEAKTPAPAPRSQPEPAPRREPEPVEPLAYTDVITLYADTPIYSARQPDAVEPLLYLKEGEEVRLVEAVSRERAKVGFISSGRNFEGLATFDDLGLNDVENDLLVLDAKEGTWGTLALPRNTEIYRMDPNGQPTVIGRLPAGTAVQLRGNLNPNVVRLSITSPNGQTRSGLALVNDLRE